MTKQIQVYWKGFNVEATVSYGYEGDPGIHNGLRSVVNVEEIVVLIDNEDFTEYLSKSALDEIEEKVRENA